jgi:hypothetical protein
MSTIEEDRKHGTDEDFLYQWKPAEKHAFINFLDV